jgi:hypothetical protein
MGASQRSLLYNTSSMHVFVYMYARRRNNLMTNAEFSLASEQQQQ